MGLPERLPQAWERYLYETRELVARLREDFDAHCSKYDPIVDAMVDADKVSAALARAAADTKAAARENSRLHLSKWQTLVATIVGLCTVASTVLAIVLAVTH